MWKEPMISDKSLSCGAFMATERHLDVCVSPRPCALLTTCTVCPLPHSGLYFRKSSAIDPLICASMTFHPCACESVCFLRDDWIYVSMDRDYRDVNDPIGDAKCFWWQNFETNQDGQLDSPSPRCVNDLLCPDSVVLSACLCSFCHTKATYSASAHNCFISHNAKLELFALLQMNMGILRHVQIAILILACIAWFSRANHEAIDMGISIWYYISKLALFTLDFVLLLRVWCVYLHIYEFILLLYIIYFLSSFRGSLICKSHTWSLRFVYFHWEYRSIWYWLYIDS